MIQKFVSSSLARALRNVVAVVAIGVWWSPGSHALECTDTPDCSLNGVCVNGACVSCVEDPGECDAYSYTLTDPFCDSQSGNCWECSDCNPQACSQEQMSCVSDCDDGMCAQGRECDTEDGCPDTCWYNPWLPTGLCVSGCAPPCI